MEKGKEFAGALAWCKKYNLCFTSEYHYMKRTLDRFEKEERLKRAELEIEVQEIEEINWKSK